MDWGDEDETPQVAVPTNIGNLNFEVILDVIKNEDFEAVQDDSGSDTSGMLPLVSDSPDQDDLLKKYKLKQQLKPQDDSVSDTSSDFSPCEDEPRLNTNIATASLGEATFERPSTVVERPTTVVHPDSVYASAEDLANVIVLDCGATQNLVGPDTVDRMQESAIENERNPGVSFDPEKRRDFRFGNDACKLSNGTCTARSNFLGREMDYHSHVVPGGAPWLGSIAFLRETGALIDFSRNLAIFSRLDPSRVVKPRTLESGHVGIPINEEAGGQLETVESDPVLERMLRATVE